MTDSTPTRRRSGLTLTELLIVIAIVGVFLTAFGITVVNQRSRTHNTSAQRCAQALLAGERAHAAGSGAFAAWTTLDPPVSECAGVTVTGSASASAFSYTAMHPQGTTGYTVSDRMVAAAQATTTAPPGTVVPPSATPLPVNGSVPAIPAPVAGDFTVSAGAYNASSKTVAVTVTRNAYPPAISFTVTASSPALPVSVTPSSTTGNAATIVIGDTDQTPAGTYTVTLSARGADGTVKAISVPVTLSGTFTLDTAGYTQADHGAVYAINRSAYPGTITLAVSTNAPGVVATVSPTSTTGSAATVSLTGDTALPAGGAYTATLTATGPDGTVKTDTFSIVSGNEFSLSADAYTPSTKSAKVTINRTAFTGAVALSASAPSGSGVVVGMTPTSTTGTSATLNINTSAATPGQTTTVTITGTAAGVTRTTTLDVIADGFTIDGTSGAASQSIGVVLNRKNHSLPITVSASSATAGLSFTVNAPNPTTESSAIIDVTVAGSVAPGTYTVTLRGVDSGGRVSTKNVPFTVRPPLAVSAGAYNSGIVPITITRTNYTPAVTLTASASSPSGATLTFAPPSTTGVTSTLNVSGSPGTYTTTITATGTDGKTASTVATITIPTRRLILSLSGFDPFNNGTNGVIATLTRSSYTNSVSLSVSASSPTGMTFTASPPNTTGTTSTINITNWNTLTPGAYTFTVTATGTDGTVSKRATTVTKTSRAYTVCTGWGGTFYPGDRSATNFMGDRCRVIENQATYLGSGGTGPVDRYMFDTLTGAPGNTWLTYCAGTGGCTTPSSGTLRQNYCVGHGGTYTSSSGTCAFPANTYVAYVPGTPPQSASTCKTLATSGTYRSVWVDNTLGACQLGGTSMTATPW